MLEARKRSFERALRAREGPYHRFYTMVFQGVADVLEQQRTDLTAKIDALFQEIYEEVDHACSRTDDDSEEAKAFREAVVARTRIAKEYFAKEIYPRLESAEKMAQENEKFNAQLKML